MLSADPPAKVLYGGQARLAGFFCILICGICGICGYYLFWLRLRCAVISACPVKCKTDLTGGRDGLPHFLW
jgi:hypothetical protein